MVQKECIGTESKVETEKLLRKAMEEYESKKIIAKTENNSFLTREKIREKCKLHRC